MNGIILFSLFSPFFAPKQLNKTNLKNNSKDKKLLYYLYITKNINIMKTHYLTITVQIKVESNLSIEEIIDEFGSETDYTFESTDNVEVLETEILEVN